jgi:hypothetical protein
MRYTQDLTCEAVEVIAHFKELEINIIRCKWNNTVYNVSGMRNSRKIRDGENSKTHYSVICESKGITAELCYHHKDFKWELIQYNNLE